MTYANPATRRLLPDLDFLGSNHPLLAGVPDLKARLQYGPDDAVIEDVPVGDRCFQRGVSYVPSCDRLRVYAVDVTDRKRAERELQLWGHVLHHAAWGVVVVDPSSNSVLAANPAFAAMHGYAVDEMIGKNLADTLAPESRGDLPAHARLAVERGRHVYESIHIRKDGTRFPALTDVTAHTDAEGNVLYRAANVQDITERNEAEESLRSLNARYEAILAAVPEIVMEVDARKVYVWANRAGYEFFGDDVVGKEAAHYFEGEQETYATVQPLFNGGEQVVYVESWQRRKDGARRLLAWWCRVLKDADGEVTGALSTARDITELKRIEENLHKSEERFRRALENVPDVVVLYDRDRRIQYINDATRQVTGRPTSDFIGHRDDEIWPPEVYGNYLPALEQAFATKTIQSLEATLAIPDSGTRALRITCVPLLDGDGEVREVLGVTHDFTERKEARDALRRRVEEMAVLHEATRRFLELSDEQAILDTLCRFVVEGFWLKMAWTGLIREDDCAVHPAAKAGFEDGFLASVRMTWDETPTGSGPSGRAIRSGTPCVANDLRADSTYGPWRKEAKRRGYASSASVPLVVDGDVLGTLNAYAAEAGRFNGELVRVIASLTNAAAIAVHRARLRRKIERDAEVLGERVAERTRALEETNTELKAFAYTVSHDLRAPLRAMEGLSRALLEDYAEALGETGGDYARRIASAAARMDDLIQDLLEYSRLGRAELDLQPVSLDLVLEDAMEEVAALIAETGADVNVEAPLGEAVGHHATLVQILANLISNAAKFVEPEKTPRVRIGVNRGEHSVRLWVQDNGIGIDEEHFRKVFLVFERLHGVETYQGTGIGLAIVRRGAERMGGRAGVESAVGRGSRFWVELPKVKEE